MRVPDHPPTRPYASSSAQWQHTSVRAARTPADWRRRKAYRVRTAAPRCTGAGDALIDCIAGRGTSPRQGRRGARPGGLPLMRLLSHTPTHAPAPPTAWRAPQWAVAFAAGVAAGVMAFSLNWATEVLVWLKYSAVLPLIRPGGEPSSPRACGLMRALGARHCQERGGSRLRVAPCCRAPVVAR